MVPGEQGSKMARDPELAQRLEAALAVQAALQPDMFLVSREGRALPAHKCVLGLFSPAVAALLAAAPPHLAPSLVLPDSGSEALCSLLGLLYTGLLPARPRQAAALREVEEAAALLGIRIVLEGADSDTTQLEAMEDDDAVPSLPPCPDLKDELGPTEGLEARLAQAWDPSGQVRAPGAGACNLCQRRFTTTKELADHKEKAHQSREEEGGAGRRSAKPGKGREDMDHSWKMTGSEKLAKIKRDFDARRASGAAGRG
jgi:hypothetical protein